MEDRHSPPWPPRKEVGERPASQKQSAPRAAAKTQPVEDKYTSIAGSVFNRTAEKLPLCRSPNPST